MTRVVVSAALAAALSLLSGCGVDGGPTRPSDTDADTRIKPGVSVSGSVGVGVAGGSTSGRVRTY